MNKYSPYPGDIIDAKLEPGEYVLNRNAVRKIGKKKLNKLNNQIAPRFKKQYMSAGGEARARRAEDERILSQARNLVKSDNLKARVKPLALRRSQMSGPQMVSANSVPSSNGVLPQNINSILHKARMAGDSEYAGAMNSNRQSQLQAGIRKGNQAIDLQAIETVPMDTSFNVDDFTAMVGVHSTMNRSKMGQSMSDGQGRSIWHEDYGNQDHLTFPEKEVRDKDAYKNEVIASLDLKDKAMAEKIDAQDRAFRLRRGNDMDMPDMGPGPDMERANMAVRDAEARESWDSRMRAVGPEMDMDPTNTEAVDVPSWAPKSKGSPMKDFLSRKYSLLKNKAIQAYRDGKHGWDTVDAARKEARIKSGGFTNSGSYDSSVKAQRGGYMRPDGKQGYFIGGLVAAAAPAIMGALSGAGGAAAAGSGASAGLSGMATNTAGQAVNSGGLMSKLMGGARNVAGNTGEGLGMMKKFGMKPMGNSGQNVGSFLGDMLQHASTGQGFAGPKLANKEATKLTGINVPDEPERPDTSIANDTSSEMAGDLDMTESNAEMDAMIAEQDKSILQPKVEMPIVGVEGSNAPSIPVVMEDGSEVQSPYNQNNPNLIGPRKNGKFQRGGPVSLEGFIQQSWRNM